MSDMRAALEPCPFCGGEAMLMHGGPGNSFAGCTVCKATSDDGSEDHAITAWNRRARSALAGSPETEVARLSAAARCSDGVEGHYAFPIMVPDPDGDYVTYTDYVALRSALSVQRQLIRKPSRAHERAW